MVFGEEDFFRMDGLTGTNLQYHLLGDLMEDVGWTKTGESGRGVRPTAGKKGSLLQLSPGHKIQTLEVTQSVLKSVFTIILPLLQSRFIIMYHMEIRNFACFSS